MFYNIYFSPTGGTKKAASMIAEVFEEETISINIFDKSVNLSNLNLTSDDTVLVSAPCYGGIAPYPAINKLEKLEGNNAKAIIVAVYGNRATDDELLQIQDLLKTRNFEIIAGIEAIAEHSLARTIAKGRPNNEDRKILNDFGKKIQLAIKNKTYNKNLTLPGNRPYKEFHGSGTKPILSSDKKCINCGSCSAQCPVNAIPEETPWNTNYDLCISCMHCVSICPTGVRITDPIKSEATTEKLKALCPEDKENKLYI